MRPDSYKQKVSKKYQAKHRAKLTEITAPTYRPKDQPFQNTLSNLATIKFESKKKELPSNAYRYKEEDLEDQESTDQIFLKEIDNETQKLITQIDKADQINFDPSSYFNFTSSLVEEFNNNENDTDIWNQINIDKLSEVLPHIALLDRLDFDSDTVEDLASFEAHTIQIKPKIIDVSIPSSLPKTQDSLQMKAPKDLEELDKLLSLDSSELDQAAKMPTIVSPSQIKQNKIPELDDLELEDLLSTEVTSEKPSFSNSPFKSTIPSVRLNPSEPNRINFNDSNKPKNSHLNNVIPNVNISKLVGKIASKSPSKHQDDDDFLDELLND